MTDSAATAPEGHVLVRAIGRGASSVVWEARRVATGAPVAMKILDAEVPAADAVRFLAGERAAMPALARHPHVLTVLDAGVQDERPWLATELCRRGSLATHVAEAGPLDVPTALRVLDRVAGALAAAHAAGALHGNVKPSNVLLTDAGEPVVGDFGAAAGATPRSEVRALGATVEELMAGAEPDPVRDDLLSLLHAMADPDGERPASMTEVAAAVRALADEHAIALDEPAFPPLAAEPEPDGAAAPAPPEPAGPPELPGPAGEAGDGWSAPLPAEQVLTFDPPGSAARRPYSADPAADPIFTRAVPFRPRVEEEPQPAGRLPLVAASVLAVLITVGAVFGISRGRDAEAAAPLSSVAPAVLTPATTTPPAPATTTAAPPTSAAPTPAPHAPTTAAPRPRTTRAPATRQRPPASSDSGDDSTPTKKKKKKSDD